MTQSTDTQSTDTSSAALVALLSKNNPKGAGRRRLWLIGGGIAVVAVLLVALSGGNGQPAGQYLTEEAAVGNLLVTASASGTLQPTKSVDVGSELSGTLSSVLVQENDVVKKGQLLAQLDTAKLKDAVSKSQAAVAAAEASVALAQATVAEMTASLNRMRQVAELSGGKVPAKTELETADAARQRAVASLASARADVVQAKATAKTDETNLGLAAFAVRIGDGVAHGRYQIQFAL